MVRSSRSVILLPALTLFLVLAAPSQTGDQSPTYKLSGTVVDSVTGRPIPRVLVRLISLNRSMLTGPEGDFSFDNMSRGTLEIVINKPGYFASGASAANSAPYGPGALHRVEVGPDAGKVVLKLAPQAVITGTVAGNDEEPLEGVHINVLASQVMEGKRRWVPMHVPAFSDEDGNFRVGGLPPGRYYVAVEAGRVGRTMLGAQSANVRETYPPIVYFPESNDLSSATPLDLAPGRHQEVRFTLKTVPSFKVAGVIANPGDWSGLSAPALVDQFEQPLIQADRFDRQSGAFEFRAVPAGNYWVHFGGRNPGEHYSYSSIHRKLAVHGNIADLRLTLHPGFDIPIILRSDFVHENRSRGHCRYTPEGGEIQESDCSDYPDARVELHSLDFPRLQFQSDAGPLKASFGIHGVAPGQYSIRAEATFGGYVQSARCGSLDLLREPLVVPEDGHVEPIEIVVRDDPATLKINVRMDKPGRLAMIAVFPDPVTAPNPQILTSSDGGELVTGPLAPGAYKVLAFDAADDFDYSSPDELAKYAPQATSVKVGANENATVVVDLIHIGE